VTAGPVPGSWSVPCRGRGVGVRLGSPKKLHSKGKVNKRPLLTKSRKSGDLLLGKGKEGPINLQVNFSERRGSTAGI